MKILEKITVPTGHILIVDGKYGKLECLSIGDYGRDHNVKADFLGLSRTPEPIRHRDMLPLEEKWVITISSQYGCSMGCEFCSPASTLVETSKGPVPIEDVKVGDTVIGYSISDQEIQTNTVEKLYARNYTGKLITIELENGKTLRLTPEHPVFLISGKTKLAKDLTQNDELLGFQ